MFELTASEFSDLRSQIGTSSWGGTRYVPMAFTEQGVAMLSSVLSSGRAIEVNIRIIRIFARMREILHSNKELLTKLEQLEYKVTGHNKHIRDIFQVLKKLLHEPVPPRRRIDLKRIPENKPNVRLIDEGPDGVPVISTLLYYKSAGYC
jgi:hypothetical protein